MEMEMEMEMEVFGTMSPTGSAVTAAATASEDEGDLRRGPWTVEEDMLLVDYIAKHGEGRWNSLARCAGLRRTGKSCRLRWLNYLRPDVRRGNITPEEQLLILELHSRWGNRWSKIAQHLPGRTDNEIKNYWRTRVQKHAKQLKCDVNSKQFRDVVRCIWMPRLVERIQADSAAAAGDTTASVPVTRTMSSPGAHLSAYQNVVPNNANRRVDYTSNSEPNPVVTMSPDTSSTPRSSLTEASHGAHFMSGATPVKEGAVVQCGGESGSMGDHVIHSDVFSGSWSELLATTDLPEFEFGDFDDSLWSLEDICLRQHC